MPRSRSGRPAFTLAEVFVVLIVVGLMLGLLLPALVASREACRRVSCLNNMRQIALGLQNYHEQFRTLPPGSLNPTGPVHNRREGLHVGWIVQLLPYAEQGGVAARVDTTASVYDPLNASAASAVAKFLRCPSNAEPLLVAGQGVSNYAGCHHDVEAPIDMDNHGVLFLNSHVRLDDIEDGTTVTLLFGEKLVDPSDLGWISGTRSTLRNTGTPINAAPGPASNDLHVGGFASRHPGGTNFGFCDGSARFVRESIRPEIYQRLGHREDGELIGEGDF
jgi:prepilin-type processing-associated H-X9-DG protein